jgi:hypothetical protein
MRPTGWVHRPADIDATCEYLAACGTPPAFGDGKPELAGHWSRLLKQGVTGVFLWEWEQPLLGKRTAVDFQMQGVDPGTCVSRGTYRACQDSYGTAIHKGLIVGRGTELAFEPIYGGSRVNVGKGALGNGGGSVGAWAARWVHDFGVTERGIYGQFDLTKPNERLAEWWGRPGVGVPSEFPRGQLVAAVHMVKSVVELADAVSAGYGVAVCSQWMFGARDRMGFSRYAGPTAHCESIRGVFRTLKGGTGFVRQQSWGANNPTGPRTLHYSGGEIEMPEGCYAVYEEDQQSSMNTGESWAMGVASPFEVRKASEFVNG